MTIKSKAQYLVTFETESDLRVARKWEELLKAENIPANAKLKELIRMECDMQESEE